MGCAGQVEVDTPAVPGNADGTVKTKGIQYPTARDAQLVSEKNWHVHYYPTYAIVDRKGIVRIVGLQPPHVETVVKKLLAEPAAK